MRCLRASAWRSAPPGSTSAPGRGSPHRCSGLTSYAFSRKLQRRVLRKKKEKKKKKKKNVSPTTLHYHHHTTITTLPSPHYHHHTTITTLQSPLPSPHYHHHSTITSPPLLNSLLFLRLGWVSPRLARCTPLRGSCVSERSRCAFLRMWICPRAPSAGIVRVGALPLCVFAHVDLSPRTLCGDRAKKLPLATKKLPLATKKLPLATKKLPLACRSAPAVRFCACGFVPAHPLRGSCVSERSRCAFLRMLQLASYTLCGDRACRSAPAVRFRTFYNLLRTPSAGIVRVGALPLCVFAYFEAWSCTLCGDRACRSLPHKCSTPRTPGAAVAGKSTFCSTNVVRRGRQELP